MPTDVGRQPGAATTLDATAYLLPAHTGPTSAYAAVRRDVAVHTSAETYCTVAATSWSTRRFTRVVTSLQHPALAADDRAYGSTTQRSRVCPQQWLPRTATDTSGWH